MITHERNLCQSGYADPMSRYSPKRIFWLCLGLLCLALGTIGAFIPLLPTTSFMLVAAFSFAKSSPRLHRWLLSHKMFGPLILNWNMYGAVSLNAKIMSLVSMVFILGLSAAFKIPLWVIGLQAALIGCVSLFLWTRPAPPSS